MSENGASTRGGKDTPLAHKTAKSGTGVPISRRMISSLVVSKSCKIKFKCWENMVSVEQTCVVENGMHIKTFALPGPCLPYKALSSLPSISPELVSHPSTTTSRNIYQTTVMRSTSFFTFLAITLACAILAGSAPLRVRSMHGSDLYPRALQVRDMQADKLVYRLPRSLGGDDYPSILPRGNAQSLFNNITTQITSQIGASQGGASQGGGSQQSSSSGSSSESDLSDTKKGDGVVKNPKSTGRIKRIRDKGRTNRKSSTSPPQPPVTYDPEAYKLV